MVACSTVFEFSSRSTISWLRITLSICRIRDSILPGDYHAAKDSQGKMESRIRQIDNAIRNHEIVERDENSNTVEHATIVQIVYEGDEDEDRQEFFIGSIEEKPDGVLVASPTSPLGSALLGHRVGEHVEYEAPSGVLRLTIVGIR